MILKKVFNQGTFSKHEPIGLFSPKMMSTEIALVIGVKKYVGDYQHFVEQRRNSELPTFVKSHDAPEGNDRTIYIVRNGLTVTESLLHYRRHIEDSVVDWNGAVLGHPTFGNWSSHLSSWSPLKRQDTLLVRYEDLVSNRADEVISQLGEFSGLRRRAKWSNPWRRLHAERPDFFRRGRADVAETITPAEKVAFMAIHGEWMSRLGYAASS